MINWNPALKNKADSLTKSLSEISNYPEFLMEVQKQATERMMALTQGLNDYTNMPIPDVSPTPYEKIWEEGSSSLFDYGGEGKKILFVPSLINKSYILDLTKNTSIINFLKDSGYNPLMIDWGEPGEKEKDFSIENYVERVCKAIDKIDEKVALAGYCMGGLIAMAATLQKQEKLTGLSLLATPWDFHSDDTENAPLKGDGIDDLKKMFEQFDFVPKELVYLMFYFLDPWPVHSKYQAPKEDEDFLAREYWIHDGMAMASKVAKEAFIDWSYHNTTLEYKWNVFDKIIDPSKITIPTLLAVPSYDRVVPPLCSRPLAELIQNSSSISSPSGHVGMIVGKNAKEHVWIPLAKWLDNL